MEDGEVYEEDSPPEDSTQDIEITAPKEPEVNPEVYRDVVALLTRGFLMVPVDIGGVPFIFKSLNHHEYDMVRLLSGFTDQSANVPPRFWDLFLAHMVLFVDGQNVLVDRRRWVAEFANTFRDLPGSARQLLIRQLSELNRKVSAATMLVEAYAMESYSRWRWAQVRDLDLSAPAITGIEGTEKLGLSYAQLSWRALNYFDDVQQDQDTAWDNAKFIGGCFAGKGIQKIYNQDRERKQKYRESRWNRKDQLLRHVLMGDPLESDKKYGGAQVIIVASTVEELADQVQRSLRGEKDWHDQMIAEYEEGIRKNVSKREVQLQEIVENTRMEMGDKPVVGRTELAGLSPGQVEQRIRQQREAAAKAWENADPKLHLDEKAANIMEKWGLADGGVGSTDRPTEGAIPLQPRRNAGKPWRP